MGTPRSLTIAAVADATLWMFTTGMGLMFIFQGKMQQHRQWMTRSFATAMIFLEARAIIDLTGWVRYLEVILWCCIAAAIPLADMVLLCREPRHRAIPRRLSRLAQQTVQ